MVSAAAAEKPVEPSGAAPRKFSKLANRAAYGTLLGALGAFVILWGGVLYSCFAAAASYQTSREFSSLITTMAGNKNTSAPPSSICDLMCVFCILFPLMAYFYPTGGKPALMLTLAAFILLCMEILTVEKPKFSQLTAAVFGLFYCGFLVSFWVKLRMVAAPALSASVAQSWPVLLGGLAHWTVGLVATLTAVLCIIAADTGAYFVGKNLGKTQLIRISPRKTVEGTVGGLLCSSAVALICFKVFSWPASPLASIGFAVSVFVASVFGDLIESILKRDAGVKDSGSLIPGHGGLLDRFDSYMFSGAVAYIYVTLALPHFGI